MGYNRYGLLEAVVYTSADLVQLGGRLLESPCPLWLSSARC